jgi:hypothetical protein|uniref:Lysozyme n=1 Tax=Siphoviridae sp. ctt5z12 TaxID=2823604 RepID=A0A8S5LBR3_9CAUD|nr:MAG TPA: Lysozyme [Siphoviridae sp. ctt5z12]
MAKFNEAFQILMRLEFSRPENALHKNPTEDGWTFMGIYQAAHPHWKGWDEILGAIAYGGNIEKISRVLYASENLRAEVRRFYKEAYWDRMRLDEISSQKKANEMFIFAVNVGIKPAVRVTQQLVGVVNDGIVGEQTLAAINRFDEARFDKEFDRAELRYYKKLIENNPKFRVYANGWKNRAQAV